MKKFYHLLSSLVLFVFFFSTTQQAYSQTYCTSSWTNLSDDWISNVTFGSINNTSASTTYTDYTATQSTVVAGGITYPISVTISIANGTWLQHAAVWIDWNQNFVFDSAEYTYLGTNQSTAPTFTINSNITVPATALPGPTRMRVIEQYLNILGPNDGCASGQYGETEDYTVIVQSSGPNDAGVVSIDSPYAVCSGVHPVVATIRNFGTNQINTVTVNWSVNGALQTPFPYSGLIDTLNGSNPSSAQTSIGTFNFASNTPYTITAWTSSPNGATDSTAINDSSSWTFGDIILPPEQLFANTILSSSAIINWTEAGQATQWEIQYGPVGFMAGNGTPVHTSNNPQIITGLTANTGYDFYVRSVCGAGDSSIWTGPGTFTTTCNLFTAPYFESFDSASWVSGTVFSNTNDVLDQCWDRNTVGYSWRVSSTNNLANHSTGTAPAADVSGAGKFVYLEASLGGVGDSAFLESPWIDISTLSAPLLTFYTHRYGLEMGSMLVQVSTGTSWSTIWSIDGAQQISSVDPWSFQRVSLCQYKEDTVKIRFVGISVGCCGGDGAIDDVSIEQQTDSLDLVLMELSSPNSNCALGIEDVTLEIMSFGADTISSGTNISMVYNINGGPNVMETFMASSDITCGDVISYNFTNKADLTTPNTYDFVAWTSIPGDMDLSNDTVSKRVLSIPVISSYPYIEDFETNQGGWSSGGENDSWAYGTPNKVNIQSASSGTKAWVTGGLSAGIYNNNEGSYVAGPCFDFSTLVKPIFKADVWWDADFADGAQIHASSDGGATWSLVGDVGQPNNWYNQANIFGLTTQFGYAQGWGGTGTAGAGGWLTAQNTLDSFAGEPGVLIRVAFGSDGFGFGQFDGFGFDDIVVLETPNRDLGAITIDSVSTGCALGAAETISVTYSNFGIDTLMIGDTIYFGYSINAGAVVSEFLVLSNQVLPGDTNNYVFSTPANLSVNATYSLSVWTDLSNDQDPTNDTLLSSITNVPVIGTFPYNEGFELGNGGWTSGGNLSTWALGTPNKLTIDTAANGTQAWTTGGLGTGPYNNDEASWVIGPCFDFTNVVRPEFDLNIWWESEPDYDGAQLQASTDGGNTWIKIGQYLDPNNWYNYDNLFGLTLAGQSPEGWAGGGFAGTGSNGWVPASNIAQFLSGESDVFVRIFFGSDGSVNTGYDGFAFDDFQVTEDALADDMRLDSLMPIQSNCGLSATTPVRAVVRNHGLNQQTNIPISYYIGGVLQVTDFIPGPLPADTTLVHTFSQPADLSMPGSYVLTASVDLQGDMDTTNNTTAPLAVVSYRVPQIIAFQGSEQCIPGPATISANADVGVVRWYDMQSGGTILATSNSYNIPNLAATTTYYAEPYNAGIIPCVGIRQAVVAELSSVPQVDFTTSQVSSLTMEFTSTLSGNVDSVWWDFGDFGAGSSDPNPTHTYSSGGTKAVDLQAFDGSCDTVVTKAIFVLGLDNSLAEQVQVYPNPTNGAFRFEANGLGGNIQLELIDQKGNTVYELSLINGSGTYSDEVVLPKSIPAGVYYLRVIDRDKSGRIKIMKE